jgi:uncharacterized protein
MKAGKLASADATGWIQTFSGGAIYPGSPHPDDVDIYDIANALARQCRYGGHCLRFYSVAEHCVLMCDEASEENKLCALLHDASEAYLIDIPRPVKPLLKGYHDLELALMRVIAKKYGFAWPMPDEVKQLDAAIVTDERQQNMAASKVDPIAWGAPHDPIGVRLQFWKPEIAAFEFLLRFYKLHGDT